MTAEEWRRVKEVLETALERDPGERAAFLDQACAGDPELRAHVEALLASDQGAGKFLEIPALRLARELTSEESVEPLTGRRLGAYRILREIGRGGMGAVYLAERADGQYRKQVAIKIVRPDLGVEHVLRRFRNERQVLADLDHPHIARLLDGGATEDGLPYLVMEHVEGMRIDAWCDSRKLSVRDRVRLFRAVCSAVQYAHERQVIHRDIKPGNILVTAGGAPKLLDFGIAKVLHPEAAGEPPETIAGLAPMTPDYASPEQARGDPAGPPSDIYALGVTLYQLLTGRLPYPAPDGDPARMTSVGREREPVKPSAAVPHTHETAGLRRQLAGGLEDIVLKALRTHPETRYASVAELSEDLDRFLQDLPVRARQPHLLYRAGKFLRRNRVPVLAAALAAVLALAVTFSTGRFGRFAGPANQVVDSLAVYSGPRNLDHTIS